MKHHVYFTDRLGDHVRVPNVGYPKRSARRRASIGGSAGVIDDRYIFPQRKKSLGEVPANKAETSRNQTTVVTIKHPPTKTGFSGFL
jgi:hypothetical protein